MKLKEDMLFGHPILSGISHDYIQGSFESNLNAQIEDDALTLSVSLRLHCEDLSTLVDEGAAGCGYYIVCPRTYFNRLIEMTPGTTQHPFSANMFFGSVVVRPVVWSKEPRSRWPSKLLHSEYGGSADLPANSVLALGDEHRFTVDRARLKPFETIFRLADDQNVEPGQFRVDPDDSKIVIRTNPTTKSSIEDIRNTPLGRTVLLNAVYFPAIMEVLTQLNAGAADFQNKAWHRIFVAKCDALGIDAHSNSPFEDAQRLLTSPFNRIDQEKERLFD